VQKLTLSLSSPTYLGSKSTAPGLKYGGIQVTHPAVRYHRSDSDTKPSRVVNFNRMTSFFSPRIHVRRPWRQRSTASRQSVSPATPSRKCLSCMGPMIRTTS
jgi:hypothetical protein